MSVFIVGYGSKIVPRIPFDIAFRPPTLAIESGGKMVAFQPGDGGLGYRGMGDATVEDVTLDVAEEASANVFQLRTTHFGVPITEGMNVSSCDPSSGHAFEVQCDGATARDDMMWIQGPYSQAIDLRAVTGNLAVVGEGGVQKRNGTAHWRECRYPLGNRWWHKRFYALALFSTARLGAQFYFVLLAQCPIERQSVVFALSDRWAAWLSSAG